MQSDIHPRYYPTANAKCACGKTWKTGSTKEELSLSICSNCHPFYTGQEKNLDARGQIERFKKRLEKSASKTSLKTSKTSKAPRAKKS